MESPNISRELLGHCKASLVQLRAQLRAFLIEVNGDTGQDLTKYIRQATNELYPDSPAPTVCPLDNLETVEQCFTSNLPPNNVAAQPQPNDSMINDLISNTNAKSSSSQSTQSENISNAQIGDCDHTVRPKAETEPGPATPAVPSSKWTPSAPVKLEVEEPTTVEAPPSSAYSYEAQSSPSAMDHDSSSPFQTNQQTTSTVDESQSPSTSRQRSPLSPSLTSKYQGAKNKQDLEAIHLAQRAPLLPNGYRRCPIGDCSCIYRQMSYLRQHIRNGHGCRPVSNKEAEPSAATDDEPTNEQRGRSFSIQLYKQAIRLPNGRYACPVGECKKSYMNMGKLQRHLRNDPHEQGAYKCRQASCAFRTRTKSMLIKHMGEQHAASLHVIPPGHGDN